MIEKVNIENVKVLTIKQVISLLIFVIVATFSLTMIYAEFRYLQKEIDITKDRIEYVNDRLTRNINKLKPETDDVKK